MDVGQRIVDYMRNRMGIEDELIVRRDRGFTWWACGLAQHIWAEPCFDDDGIVLSRIHVRTDLLQGLPNTDAALSELALVDPDFITLSGMIRDPDDPSRVQKASSTYVHTGTEKYLQMLLVEVALLQLAEAHQFAEPLSMDLDCRPAFSSHPSSPISQVWLERLEALMSFVVQVGQTPPECTGEEMSFILSRLQGRPVGAVPAAYRSEETSAMLSRLQHTSKCVMAVGDGSSIGAEFPYGSRTSLLRLDTKARHPQFGNGLWSILSIPAEFSEENCAAEAIRMNDLELRSLVFARFLGSWRAVGNVLTYVSFYPNSVYRHGWLFDILMAAAIRAKWIAEEVMGEQPAERPLSAMERFLRMVKGQ